MARTPHSRFDCHPGCAVEAALSLIDGKWKGVILFQLLKRTTRFNELRRLTPSVSQRSLTNQLRELEADGLVARTVHAEVPPRVEYSLTPLGRSLEPILLALKHWGDAHLARFGEDPPDADGSRSGSTEAARVSPVHEISPTAIQGTH